MITHTRSLALLSGLALAGGALASTVTVSLTSPQDGLVLAPGATINWTISFSDSPGDNQGLALLVVDLVQDGDNPATLNIPPASGVPAAMVKFSRPQGISNPGESDPTTGYVGVQRGTAGAMNLVQIGGAQNNFGVAQPSGTGIAENAIVSGGIGQSGAVTLASGSFTAPSACGTYIYTIENVYANVLDSVATPPNFSPVSEAAVDATANTISFEVGLVGDIDGNGVVDLIDLSTLLTQFGQTGSGLSGDLDGNNVVDLIDLSMLLANFGASCG